VGERPFTIGSREGRLAFVSACADYPHLLLLHLPSLEFIFGELVQLVPVLFARVEGLPLLESPGLSIEGQCRTKESGFDLQFS